MSEDQEAQGVLTAHDSGEQYDVYVYLDQGQRIGARARCRLTFSRCADHLVAHGICIDCTRKAGHIVGAT